MTSSRLDVVGGDGVASISTDVRRLARVGSRFARGCCVLPRLLLLVLFPPPLLLKLLEGRTGFSVFFDRATTCTSMRRLCSPAAKARCTSTARLSENLRVPDAPQKFRIEKGKGREGKKQKLSRGHPYSSEIQVARRVPTFQELPRRQSCFSGCPPYEHTLPEKLQGHGTYLTSLEGGQLTFGTIDKYDLIFFSWLTMTQF